MKYQFGFLQKWKCEILLFNSRGAIHVNPY